MGRNVVNEGAMDIDEELPEINLKSSKVALEESSDVSESDLSVNEGCKKESECKNKEESKWTAFECGWQDFIPVVFTADFRVDATELPSLLSLISGKCGDGFSGMKRLTKCHTRPS